MLQQMTARDCVVKCVSSASECSHCTCSSTRTTRPSHNWRSGSASSFCCSPSSPPYVPVLHFLQLPAVGWLSKSEHFMIHGPEFSRRPTLDHVGMIESICKQSSCSFVFTHALAVIIYAIKRYFVPYNNIPC